MLDSPYFTDLTKSVLAKRDAIVEAVFARNGVMDDPTEAAFTEFVDTKVFPAAQAYKYWMEAQEAGNVTSIPETMLSQTMRVLGEALYEYSLQAQGILDQAEATRREFRKPGTTPSA
jgi:hypothetical protein